MAHEKILAALRGLGELHQAGVLDAEEFQRKKGHLLAQVRDLSGDGAASPMPPPQEAEAFVTGDAASSTAAAPATPKAATPAPSAPRKAGERSTSPGLGGAAFVWCPPGTFRMGSDDKDPEARSDEKPARDVTLTRGFWMKTTPVTQAEWQAVAGFNRSYFKGAGSDAPVERVSWFEAVWFCNQLSKKEGLPEAYLWSDNQGSPGQDGFKLHGIEVVAGSQGYRLPTEAEWEYAARAGTTSPRDSDPKKVAWYRGNSVARTHSVGGKQANAWGLYDTLGNVWEWCFDAYADSYEGLLTSDPSRVSGGPERVARGGSWCDNVNLIRAAQRGRNAPTTRSHGLGFRLLRYG